MQSIKVTIPWAALVTDHCTLEVTGLQITCRPKDRTSKLMTLSQPGWLVLVMFSPIMWDCVKHMTSLVYTGGTWDSQGWSSCMTSSMQLAQECLKDPPEASEEPPAPLEGLEMFAQTIETGVCCRSVF